MISLIIIITIIIVIIPCLDNPLFSNPLEDELLVPRLILLKIEDKGATEIDQRQVKKEQNTEIHTQDFIIH